MKGGDTLEKSQCVILETIFKHFGKMYLANMPESERDTVIKYIRGEGFDKVNREATREAETALREFWAKADREKIQLSRGEVNDAISESGKSFSENSGDP